MRANKILKVSGMIMTGFILFNMSTSECKAATSIDGEQSIAGITVGIENYYNQLSEDGSVSTLSLAQYETNFPENLGVAKVDSYLNIRKGPGTNYAAIGKLPKNGGCKIISTENGWAYIESGEVKGYVSCDYLYTGDEALAFAYKVARVKACVKKGSGGLRVRETTSTAEGVKILDTLGVGEKFDVDTELIINKDDPIAKTWVKIKFDNDYGYVAYDHVTLALELESAVRVDDLSGLSSTGAKIIETAKKYLGNRYVYGGNSLTGGIDCSAFVQQIFRMYGYSLPRTSRSQANCGTSISSSSAKAGDLVFYGSGGVITHVAICMGNGRIIHASNPSDGIKISNMYYRTPAKVVRIIK